MPDSTALSKKEESSGSSCSSSNKWTFQSAFPELCKGHEAFWSKMDQVRMDGMEKKFGILDHLQYCQMWCGLATHLLDNDINVCMQQLWFNLDRDRFRSDSYAFHLLDRLHLLLRTSIQKIRELHRLQTQQVVGVYHAVMRLFQKLKEVYSFDVSTFLVKRWSSVIDLWILFRQHMLVETVKAQLEDESHKQQHTTTWCILTALYELPAIELDHTERGNEMLQFIHEYDWIQSAKHATERREVQIKVTMKLKEHYLKAGQFDHALLLLQRQQKIDETSKPVIHDAASIAIEEDITLLIQTWKNGDTKIDAASTSSFALPRFASQQLFTTGTTPDSIFLQHANGT
jgi:hypothetical protein